MDEYLINATEIRAEAELGIALKQIRNNLPHQPDNFNGRCEDCGNDIPPARVNTGAITCLPCQNHREQMGRTMKRRR